MRRPALGIGLATVALGAIALLLGRGRVGTAVAAFVSLLAIFGVILALWKLAGTPGTDAPSVVQSPWTEGGALFERAPERTDTDESLSGESFAAVLAEAAEAARSGGTVEAGYETVRPVLRRALIDALVLHEGDRAAVERAVDEGTWTDDRTARAVLAPGVEPPPLSLRERIEAWLFPERVVRRQLQRTVQSIAEAADEAIPNVPGQNAPRNVPIVQPRLEDLQRGVDGRIQQAVDPLATDRGPRPPGEEVAVDIDDEEQTDEEQTDETGSDEVAETNVANDPEGDEPSEDRGDRPDAASESDDRTLFFTEEGDR